MIYPKNFIIKFIFQKMRPCLPVFFAHCLVPLIVLVCVIIGLLASMAAAAVGPFNSLDKSKLDQSEDPIMFLQLTDVHFHHLYTDRVAFLKQLFINVSNHLRPDILILSGDVADGNNHNTAISMHMQYEGNWDIINKTFHETKILETDAKFIVVPGNHDMYGVGEDTMQSNKFRRQFFNESTIFDFQTYQIREGAHPINLVCFSPLTPPMIGAPMGLMPYVKKDLLNRIDDAYKPGQTNILINHFPLDLLWSGRNKNSKNIRKVSEQYDVMLTGHTHPPNPEISKKGDLLHIVSSPGFRTSNVTIISVDNGNPAFHKVDAAHEKQAIITYPINTDSIHSDVVFSANEFDVKVVLYSNSTDPLTLKIDDVDYTMNLYKVLKENVSLYKVHVNLTNGNHHMVVVDANYENDYFIGTTYTESKKRSGRLFSTFNVRTMLGLAIFCSLYTIIRIIPFWLIGDAKEKLDNFQKILSGETESKEIPIYMQLVLGMFDYFTRYRHLSLFSYILMVVLTLWIFVLPLFISGMDTKYAAVFIYGSVVNGDITYFATIFMVWLLYSIFFLMPIGSFVSLYYETKKAIWEMVILCIPILFIVCVWFVFAYVAGEAKSIFGSTFTWVAIIGIILIILDIYFDRKKECSKTSAANEEENHEPVKQEAEL